LIDRLIKGWG